MKNKRIISALCALAIAAGSTAYAHAVSVSVNGEALPAESIARNGMTYTPLAPLLDAIGGAIHHIANVHKYAREEDVPEHTIFVIITDGKENASRRYTSDRVKQMIEKEKTRYGWEFLFLGANIDAVETASHFGIAENRAVTYRGDREGTRLNYDVVSDAVKYMRCSEAGLSDSWKQRIEEDVQERK